MTRRNIIVFVFLLCVFAVSFLVLTFDVFGEQKPKEVLDISFVVRGKTSDSWASMRQGAEQAASEMNVNLSFITLTEENDAQEQVGLFDREVINGADAILVSAADSEAMIDPVREAQREIPVICVESKVYDDSFTSYISADNYAMGRRLADELIEQGYVRKNIAVVTYENDCDNINRRKEGLMDTLSRTNNAVSFWTLKSDGTKGIRQLQELLNQEPVDTIVALDLSILELAAQMIDDNELETVLFGIGATGKVAYYVEQGVISATIVQNDFANGYLGVQSAVDAIMKKPVEKEIRVEYRLINKDNMYKIENQRLLFPFVR